MFMVGGVVSSSAAEAKDSTLTSGIIVDGLAVAWPHQDSSAVFAVGE